MAIFGLLLAILNYELSIYNYKYAIDIEKYPTPDIHPRVNDLDTVLCRLTIFITTLISICCLFVR